VNIPRHPLRINVGFLLNAPIGYSRDIHFDYPQIRLEDEYFTRFTGMVRVNRTPQGILVQSDFLAFHTVECVRCLEEFAQELHCEFSELYAFNRRSTTESNLVLREDGNIDLESLAREYLLIEIPISPLCRPDCLGLCPECGQNLNLGICEHSVRVTD